MNMGMNVKYLITLTPRVSGSAFFHYPNIEWTELQSKAIGIPLLKEETSGLKDREVDDLKRVLEPLKSEIDGVVAGALESRHHSVRIDRVCRALGLKWFFPNWGRSMKQYIGDLVASGFESIITAVSAEGMDESWLGRRLDIHALRELEVLSRRYGIHKGGEGREYETFVLDGPIFRKRIKITGAKKKWDGVKGVYVIEDAKLVDKD